MIRSSNIPPLLSKICTDGIQSSLLVTADGELLGNSENYDLDSFGQSLTAQDSADIGALVAEVAADYRRLGCELSLLDSKKNERNDFDMHGDRTNENHSSGNIGISAANSKGNTATMKRNPEAVDDSSSKMNANNKERGRFNCLIIELDKGLVGIASASSNNYVVALANQNVNHGMLKGRLIALADHVREAFMQIRE